MWGPVGRAGAARTPSRCRGEFGSYGAQKSLNLPERSIEKIEKGEEANSGNICSYVPLCIFSACTYSCRDSDAVHFVEVGCGYCHMLTSAFRNVCATESKATSAERFVSTECTRSRKHTKKNKKVRTGADFEDDPAPTTLNRCRSAFDELSPGSGKTIDRWALAAELLGCSFYWRDP